MKSIAPQYWRRPLAVRGFTMVEMLAAMAILSFIVLMLFQFTSSAQRIWRQSRSNAEIYERAKLFFDIVTRDLQSMAADDTAGAQINYCADTSVLPSGMKMALVTASGIGLGASDRCPLMEVGYAYNSTNKTVYRFMTRQSDGSAWNFYNTAATTWAASASWSSDTAVLAQGVSSFTITPYKMDNTPLTSDADDTMTVPSYVRVTISLFDPRFTGTGDTNLNRTARGFSKTIFLNRGNRL